MRIFRQRQPPLTGVLSGLSQELQALVRVLGTVNERTGALMATIDDLTAAVTTATADETAEAGVIAQLTTAVQALVTALQAAGGGIPPAAQAAIDAAVTGLATVHTAVGVDETALSGLVTEADAAVTPPAPVPPVA